MERLSRPYEVPLCTINTSINYINYINTVLWAVLALANRYLPWVMANNIHHLQQSDAKHPIIACSCYSKPNAHWYPYVQHEKMEVYFSFFLVLRGGTNANKMDITRYYCCTTINAIDCRAALTKSTIKAMRLGYFRIFVLRNRGLWCRRELLLESILLIGKPWDRTTCLCAELKQ